MTYHDRNELQANTIQEINFNYTLSGNDTLFQDEYQSLIFSYYPDSISNIRKLRINYTNGIPNGEFYLEKASFITNNNFPTYRSFRIQQAITGKSLFVTGRYVNGIRTGTWTQYDTNIDGKKMDTLATIHATFSKNGSWGGAFSIEDTIFQLNGQMNEGFPDGIWNGRWNGKRTELHFQNGRLTRFLIDNQSLDLTVETDGIVETVSLHEIFPQYIALFPTKDIHFSSDAVQVAKKIASSIRGFIPNKNMTVSKNRRFNFDAVQLKLPVSYLSNEDLKILDEIKKTYLFLSTEIKSILNEPMLLLSCTENPTVAQTLAVFRLISERLQKMNLIFDVSDSPVAKYVNWKNIIEQSIDEINLIHTQAYSCLDETSIKTIPVVTYNSTSTPIKNLQIQLDELTSLYDTYQEAVNKEIIEVQHGHEMSAIRHDFINGQQLFETELEVWETPDFTFPYQKEYLNGFKKFNELLVRRFKTASENSDKEKMENLNQQAQKHRQLLIEKTSDWIRLHNLITEKYTYMYLDPNTFEERKEILYVSLYKAYERKLMPYVISQLSYNFNHVEEFNASFENIEIVQQSMFNSLDKNPKKLNRKLKNRDTIEKVVEKMGLILN